MNNNCRNAEDVQIEDLFTNDPDNVRIAINDLILEEELPPAWLNEYYSSRLEAQLCAGIVEDEKFPALQINSENELLDGYHRLAALLAWGFKEVLVNIS